MYRPRLLIDGETLRLEEILQVARNEVTVELSPGSEARLSKRAIAVVMPDEDEAEPVEPETEASEPVGENRR